MYTHEEINEALKSPQGIFDFVLMHITRQGELSKSLPGNCYYRYIKQYEDGSTKTLACFVGAFIHDDEYHSDFEGKRCSKLSNFGITKFDKHIKLFNFLQPCHDVNYVNIERNKPAYPNLVDLLMHFKLLEENFKLKFDANRFIERYYEMNPKQPPISFIS